jgi:hypothetical protein
MFLIIKWEQETNFCSIYHSVFVNLHIANLHITILLADMQVILDEFVEYQSHTKFTRIVTGMIYCPIYV